MLPDRKTRRSMSVLVGAAIAWVLMALVALVFAALAVRAVVWLLAWLHDQLERTPVHEGGVVPHRDPACAC